MHELLCVVYGRIKTGRQPKKVKKITNKGLDSYTGCKIVLDVLKAQGDDSRKLQFENDEIYGKIMRKIKHLKSKLKQRIIKLYKLQQETRERLN